MSEEDVERFLYDVERELRHIDGEKRRELLRKAEERLHEVATEIASQEGAEHVEWYHYVQASAHIGPPDRLAAELTGEPLPERGRSHRWMIAGAAGLALIIVGMVGYAVLTTGPLEPIGEWEEELEAFSGQRNVTFSVSGEAESVFLQLRISPATGDEGVRVTVLDGANRLVYNEHAGPGERVETSRFIEGEAGTWRVFIDLDAFTGSWEVQAQEEQPSRWF